MKKHLLIFTIIIFFISSSAQAKAIRVISLENFSTANPSSTYKVQVIEKEELKDGTVYEAGTIICGEVVKVKNAQRGKRDGYFEFVPTFLIYNNETCKIKDPNVSAKVVGYAPINPMDIAEKAAKGAVGLFFKGASQGISFVQGVAEDKDGNRLKSGFVKMYKDSPLTYIEEGKELNVNVGDLIVLKFKKFKPENY